MASYIIHTRAEVHGKYHVEGETKEEALENWNLYGGDIIEEEELSSEVTLVERTDYEQLLNEK